MSRKEMNQIRCIAALTAGFAKKFDLGQRKVYYIFYNPVTYSRIQDQSTGLYYHPPPTIHTLTCNRSQQPVTIEGKYIFFYICNRKQKRKLTDYTQYSS